MERYLCFDGHLNGFLSSTLNVYVFARPLHTRCIHFACFFCLAMRSSSSASNQVATFELRTSAPLNREERATEFIEIRCSEGNGQQEGYGSAEVCFN